MAGPSDEGNDKKTELCFASQVQEFDFSGEAIDTSLRKLLAKVVLPKESQQIDRAMEDFAKQYYECNPTLVDSPDIVYAVAFSLLLLHTDAHNKNVKQKMNKDTFIMRTKIVEGGESVPQEILDIMYDNILASEFTYADSKKEPTVRTERSNSWFSKLKNNDNSTTNLQNIALLNDLSQRLEQLMPSKNTFSYKRTSKPIPIMEIHFSLLKAKSLCLSGVRSRHNNDSNSNTFSIKVTKAGILDRKYDLIQGGKKATARSWRPFGVILSGSQIIFFTDISAFQNYLSSQSTPKRNNSFPAFSSITADHNSSHVSVHSTVNSMSSLYNQNDNLTEHLITPIPTSSSSTNTASASFQSYLRPVQIVSLSYAVCIYDESYSKYPYVFRLLTGDGQQFLIRAEDEKDMEDWMLKINYAATLKTTGVRMNLKTKRHQDIQDSGEKMPKGEMAKLKFQELSDRIEEQVKILDRELQLRQNLMVLSPIQKSSKDRIISFADGLGKRIRTKRIELQRLQCYRDYLEAELNWNSSQQQKNQQSRKLSLPLPSHIYSLIPPTNSTQNESDTTPSDDKQDGIAKLSNFTCETTSEDSSSSSASNSNLMESAISRSNHSDQLDESSENESDIPAKDSVEDKQEGSTSAPQLPPLSFSDEDVENKPKNLTIRTKEMERIMRRRSQSNPIIPNSRNLIIDKKLLYAPQQHRKRSGSEASSVQGDDDDMSVIMVNDSEELLNDITTQ